MKINRKRGAISTALTWIIGSTILAITFYSYMETNIITMKYENLSQYTRDTLLILETKGEIEKSYLLDCKQKLSQKLNIKTGETLNIYLKVGTNNEYNISSTTTPSIIKTDYGDTIKVRYVYTYNNKKVSFKDDGFRVKITNKVEKMESDLQSISKNRNTSDD